MASKIKLIFLGTSAQIPTSRRNHTGILLSYKSENILIDCGEGIQRQFRKARLNPCKVTRILLTHWHGDHVFGLPGILSTLSFSGYCKIVYIYGPRGTKKFVNDLLKLFNFQKNFKIVAEDVFGKFFETEEFFLEAERMKHGIPTNAYSFVIKDKLRIDKKKLLKTKIPIGRHLAELQKGKDVVVDGKKYKFKDLTYLEKGKKVSVVLDTLNNERIVAFVKGADVFVSESSFSSENSKEAKEHLHLTSEQAGQIAKKARVGKLILTHISQRYEKNLKSLLDDAKRNFKNVQIVKDLDEVEV